MLDRGQVIVRLHGLKENAGSCSRATLQRTLYFLGFLFYQDFIFWGVLGYQHAPRSTSLTVAYLSRWYAKEGTETNHGVYIFGFVLGFVLF